MWSIRQTGTVPVMLALSAEAKQGVTHVAHLLEAQRKQSRDPDAQSQLKFSWPKPLQK